MLKPSEKVRSHKASLGWIAAILAWFAILALGWFWLFGPNQRSHLIRPTGYHEEMSDLGAADSLGGGRRAALVAATRHYVAEHPDAPADMREGRAFAPADALNADLASHGAKWRVRSVHGTEAQIYEVS